METPEILLAGRLVERFALSPPVDIESLVRKYADLVFADIPQEFGVDGICLDLKVLGKSPRVIVNNASPTPRKRFTLAHELGHIVIPWHLGSIVDHIDIQDLQTSSTYWELEREANSFAAEVLMPRRWLEQLLESSADLASSHRDIAKTCGTSIMAAAIRLANFLPPGVAYACVRDGLVQSAGKSAGTIALSLDWNSQFQTDAYSYAELHFNVVYGSTQLHWWILPSSISIETQDGRNWREILDGILGDICGSQDLAHKMKQSINGVAAYAHSTAKKTGSYTPEAVASACVQRYQDRTEYAALVNHPDFDAYVVKRSAAFFSK